MSIMDSLLTRQDIVVYDKDCHACIYDGIRMHLGKRVPFEHNDVDSFEKQIKKAKLWENANSLQKGLRERGFDLGNTSSCVMPVYMHGSVEEAMVLVKDLRDNYDIFCSVVVYPVIPKDMILLRLIPTAVHNQEDIDLTIEAFTAIYAKLKNGEYQKQAAYIKPEYRDNKLYQICLDGWQPVMVLSSIFYAQLNRRS